MKHAQLILLLVAVLLVGAALGYGLAHRSAAPDSVVEARKVLYWHDPMVPGQKFDKPGKSPFMDMQLVPVYADETAPDGAVRVSANVAQNLGIRLGKAEMAQLHPHLNAVGSVAFDEERLELVQARVQGYINRLYVKSPQQQVKRGQPLADIVAPEWLSAQEEYLSLLSAQSERGKAIREAARQRLIALGVPESTIRHIEMDQQTSATTTLYAPIDGVVTELGAREGAAFMPGATLFRINGLETLWINAQVPETQISLMPSGSQVIARANAWPDIAFAGRLLAVLPDVDTQTRTQLVRVIIDNAQRKLAVGMFVSLEFSGAESNPQLVVPSEAVIQTGTRKVVIVAHDGGGYDVVEVTTGVEVDDRTAILTGLEEGQSIVLSGQFLLDSEASLRSAVTRLAPEGTAP